MRKVFTFGLLLLLSLSTATNFASGKAGTSASLRSVTADEELAPPAFSSANASDETWYYIRFARRAAANLVWTTDYPTNSNSWAIKQLEQKTDDKHTQHWKLVGSSESFYIVNRATGFNVVYAAVEDAERGIRGGNYIVDANEGVGTTLNLFKSTDCVGANGALWTGALSWVINNPTANSSNPNVGFMNDRAANTDYPWRDVCYYSYCDDGFRIEFVQAEGHTIVIPSDSLSIEAPVGATGEGVFVGIASFGLTQGITATIEGADATAFGFGDSGNTLPSEGGSLTITFSPQAVRAHNATLVLSSEDADPVSIRLMGNGFDPSELPLISSFTEENEYWYYIQFHRNAAANTVWALSDTTQMIVQDTLNAAVIKLAQQWKICGSWEEGYSLINKSDEKEMAYNTIASADGTLPADRYMQTGAGDVFDFVRFNTGNTPTATWQLRNRSYAENPATTTTTRFYINDQAGRFLCNYVIDDGGNRLNFIPTDESRLIIPVDSLIFSVGLGETLTQALVISGLNLTKEISVSISGNDAGIFTINDGSNPVILPATGGRVNVKFIPSVIGEYSAQLTVACEGYPDKQVYLKGSCYQVPVKISKGDSEYWYRLQFTRRAGKLIVDKGLNQIILQEDTVAGAAVADNQLWKFTGTWDRYRIVAKSSREFKYDAEANGGRYVAAASGTGDLFRLEANADGAWGFYNMTLSSGNRYMNDNAGTQIGHYSFDTGGPFNFLPMFSSINASDLPFDVVEAGSSSVKELRISTSLLTSPITYVLTNDEGAFTVSGDGTLPQEGGALTVTFTPTAKRAYLASLTLSAAGAEDLVVWLTGTADFTLPLTISTSEKEVWYYVQFERKPALVWTADEYLASIKQAAKVEGEPKQQWKFTGTWDSYRIINRNGGAVFYDEGDTKLAVLMEEITDGDLFAFKRLGTSWQLQIIGKSADEAAEETYLNDLSGTEICLYLANDEGNPLLFTPVGETSVPAIDPNDAVVAVKYYTLQGVEITRPASSGIYIVRNTYASGKVKAVKRMIIIR